jgi:hypothetical protein
MTKKETEPKHLCHDCIFFDYDIIRTTNDVEIKVALCYKWLSAKIVTQRCKHYKESKQVPTDTKVILR